VSGNSSRGAACGSFAAAGRLLGRAQRLLVALLRGKLPADLADQAQEYLASDFYRDATQQMGVLGTPETLVLEGLEEGSA